MVRSGTPRGAPGATAAARAPHPDGEECPARRNPGRAPRARFGGTSVDRHPRFDLWLHDDAELAAAVGASLAERATIHEWPLSCVQRVRTTDGRRFIYKVSAPPTVEAEFYARARSPVLIAARALPAAGTTTALLMEELVAPRLADARPADAPALAERLVRCIGSIEGDPPALHDISTRARWTDHMCAALDDIRACVAEGTFREVDAHLADRLERLASSPPVLEAVEARTGYVHGDLMAENVLVAGDGYRVLDWQRPLRGPTALDAATLLLSLGLDAARHVGPGVVLVHHLLHVAWFGQSARRWLPHGKPHLDRVIARIGREVAAG